MTNTPNEILVPNFNIEAVNEGLKRLSEVKAEIAQYKSKAEALVIKDMDDKEGYKAVREMRLEIVKKRTPLERERKVAIAPLNETVTGVNGAYNNCTSQFSEIEAKLKLLEDNFTAFHEKKKIEEAEAKEKAIEEKISLLIESGLEYSAENGYYKNDRGIAINRQSLITMSEEDFTMLTSKARERKLEIEKEQEELEKKIAMVQRRISELLSAGMLQGLSNFVVSNERESTTLELTPEQVNVLPDAEFDALLDKVRLVVTKNAEYKAEQKAKADKFAADQKKFEEDKAEFERQQAEAKENALRDKAKTFRDRLEVEGFVYAYGEDLQTSTLSFINRMGNKTVTVGQLLENESLLAETIDAATALKKKLIDADNADKIDAEKKAKAKAEADAIEEKNRKAAEARKKVASQKDIAVSTPFVQTLTEVSDDLSKEKYAVIEPYITTLCDEVNAAIAKFKNATKHLG